MKRSSAACSEQQAAAAPELPRPAKKAKMAKKKAKKSAKKKGKRKPKKAATAQEVPISAPAPTAQPAAKAVELFKPIERTRGSKWRKQSAPCPAPS